MNDIPNFRIGAVSDVLAGHFYSHSKINSLFMKLGAPGDEPDGNLVDRCTVWFRRVNSGSELDGLVLWGELFSRIWIYIQMNRMMAERE